MVGRRIALLIAVLVGVAGCATLPAGNALRSSTYDYNNVLLDRREMSIERIVESMVAIRTVAEFRREDGGLLQRDMEGTGVVLLGKYILTLNHVASIKQIEHRTPFGTLVEPATKVAELTTLQWNGKEVPLERALVDEGEDVLIFRVPDRVRLPSFPYRIGNSDDLRLGNFVYVIGNPMNSGINVREGIVSNLRPPGMLGTIARLGSIFMVSNGLNPGDSGTPVVALRDGQFELVGLAQGTIMNSQRMGWAVKINTILGLIHAMEAREGASKK
ncbi:MAG: serine protease [Candidatus Sungiibacteriota bacterium]|uniref:Serine protease n=1 Tax=Candidatus Sungiibacteriota bacterium TaxID=2750080 RepID=A0A7T5RJK9_9BACT|nr:MAG: serine protease [Candidatus Sungbacteria bacterium]